MARTILLIDDDADEYLIFQDALELINLKTKLHWLSSAEQLHEYLRELTPDIIFVDLNMPKIYGLTCVRWLKNQQQTKNIPVVIYSTTITEVDKTIARSLGVFDTMEKASDMQSLASRLEKLFAALANKAD